MLPRQARDKHRESTQKKSGVSLGTLTVTGEWGASAKAQCSLPAGSGACVVPTLQAKGVALWWPNGLGNQRLYNVTASFVPDAAAASAPAGATAASAAVVRRIGFRFAPLVTINDTSAEAVAAAEKMSGTGNHTVMMRVNGAAIMAKGANMVPMEVPAPVNIGVKRLKFRLSGSARKSQKRFRDTPTFKIQAVLARIQPFQRSNERSERGDHPVRLSGFHTNVDRSRYSRAGTCLASTEISWRLLPLLGSTH